MEKIAVDGNGWIRGGPAENVVLKDGWEEKKIETDQDIDPRDPSKHEKAWHYNGGEPELRETGNNISPDPDEARGVILTVAETELGWDQAKIRSVRNDQKTNLFFDYLTEGNYDKAKSEIDYIVNDTDLITSSEGQTFKDALDGKI